jgi:hypothetical protein
MELSSYEYSRVGVLETSGIEGLTSAPEASGQSAAEAEIRLGKGLVVAGFAVSIVGIIVYCTAAFSAESAQELSGLGKLGLLIVGAGVVSWFSGAITYFRGAIESSSPEDLF